MTPHLHPTSPHPHITALFLSLKVIALLPIAYVHSKLLFNEGCE